MEKKTKREKKNLRERETKKHIARDGKQAIQTVRSEMTVEHASAPLRGADDATISSLRLSLVDDEAPLAARYRALFSLRNLAGEKAEQALIEGEEKKGAKS